MRALVDRGNARHYWWICLDTVEQAQDFRLWFSSTEETFGDRSATWMQAIDGSFAGGRARVDRIEFLIEGERLPLYKRTQSRNR